MQYIYFMWKISISKMFSMFLLVIVIIIALVLSGAYSTKSVKEGLLARNELTSIKSLLEKYVSNIEYICQSTITGGTNANNGIGYLNQVVFGATVQSNIQNILTNTSTTNTYKVSQIIAQNISDNKQANDILTANQGAQYTELLKLLKNIQELDINDDSKFTDLLKEHLNTPVLSGTTSTYNMLNNYVNFVTSSNTVSTGTILPKM